MLLQKISLLVTIFVLTPLYAENIDQFLTHDQLLRNVQLNREQDSEINKKRIEEFENRRNQQVELLKKAQLDVKKQKGISDQLDARLKKMSSS